MSDNQKEFTDSEKLSIVQEASGSDRKEVEAIAEKYGVTPDEILKWRHESNATVVDRKRVKEIVGYGHEDEKVYLEANDTFIDSVSYGAVKDTLNYSRLTFWIASGTIILVAIVLSVMAIHSFTAGSAWQDQSEASQFYDLQKLRESDNEILESFGVVDPDAGIYRIPIDSAITIIVNE